MRSATPATGRVTPPRRKTVASMTAALPPAAFSPISNRNKTAFKNPCNPMKIKAAPLSNRNTNPDSAHPPQSAAPAFAECSALATGGFTSYASRITGYESHPRVTNRAFCVPVGSAGHESRITEVAVSNRHSSRLEIVICHSKQRTALGSNRHFFAGWLAHFGSWNSLSFGPKSGPSAIRGSRRLGLVRYAPDHVLAVVGHEERAVCSHGYADHPAVDVLAGGIGRESREKWRRRPAGDPVAKGNEDNLISAEHPAIPGAMLGDESATAILGRELLVCRRTQIAAGQREPPTAHRARSFLRPCPAGTRRDYPRAAQDRHTASHRSRRE